MTKEITDILLAYRKAQQDGHKAALATVVHVEGSSYRRPGARMLVEDNGKMTGAISGGCLEGDALRKALQAINQQENKLVTYNTLDDDDIQFGVQLGCNGIVHILFEPIIPDQKDPIIFLERFLQEEKAAALATLFSLKDYNGPQPGTCFFTNGVNSVSNFKAAGLEIYSEAEIQQSTTDVLSAKSSLIKPLTGNLTGFFEFLPPAVSLVIAGAGNDALPLVDMASILGWQITVMDGRSTHASRQRFPRVHKVIVGKPKEALAEVRLTETTVFVLMTHNYNYDLELFKLLLDCDCRYIGTLGPRTRLERLFKELEGQGVEITADQRKRIFGPTGLDIGAEAAEEIALSILSEIKAVLANRTGTFLRERVESIHSNAAV
jgi:xanthine dehydrogenase accessory factor